MNVVASLRRLACAGPLLFSMVVVLAPLRADSAAVSLTPPPSRSPQIHGPSLFGVRPGSPFLYTIPATGDRPMKFAVRGLPAGLVVDPGTGQITGKLRERGTTTVTLVATNARGNAEKVFRIVVGDEISLTPAMGWNSWNCWAAAVDQEKVLRSARALVTSGLANVGWSYVNIDDTWQGQRSGPDHALAANEKFPDMAALCAEIHRLGLKAGIYSTPWITSYAKFPGGSSDAADGAWSQSLANSAAGHRLGAHDFAVADAKQWSAWGFDYLKYDWNPNDIPHTETMSRALRASGRDVVFSLSNSAPFAHAAEWARLANSWRTTGDIWDRWAETDETWQFGVSEIGFSQARWTPHAGPGHWNDPDMLVVGKVGWGPKLHLTTLTPDEQYSHISLWCLLSAPLLIGCDLEQIDAFTLGLLTNAEVLALDQDALGKQAVHVASLGPVDIFLKELEDGSRAMGFFNRSSEERSLTFNKLRHLEIGSKLHVRDLWRQIDLPDISDVAKQPLQMTIPAHGVKLYKLTAY